MAELQVGRSRQGVASADHLAPFFIGTRCNRFLGARAAPLQFGHEFIRRNTAQHHTAFDTFFLSIRPDYVIEIRRDVMEEVDGPVLKHALQGLHGNSIELPKRLGHRPDRERLEVRHQRFLEAGR